MRCAVIVGRVVALRGRMGPGRAHPGAMVVREVSVLQGKEGDI